MHRKVFFAFLLVFLISFQYCYAGIGSSIKPTGITAGQKVDDDDSSAVPELTQMRWAVHTDAVTGAKKMRLVFDVSGPVTVESRLTGAPTPRLVVSVKGAVPGKIGGFVKLDGDIANNIRIAGVGGGNTVLTLEMPLLPDDSGYNVFTLKKDPVLGKPFRVVIDIEKPLPPIVFHFTPGLKGKLITIDPGHGGSDPGAIGPTGIQEKTVNLAVALKVQALLENAGAKVLMTHDDDSDVYGPNASDVEELSARTAVGNNRKSDIFVSIHSNSFVNADAKGTAVYYNQKTAYDSLLAKSIQATLIPKTGLIDRGYFPANFYVLRRTLMPAALVEMGFISNPDEEKLLNDPVFQQKVALGIVQGMERFFAQAAEMGGDR